MERVIKPNSEAGYEVDYFLGLNKAPFESSIKTCDPYIQDPILTGLDDASLRGTVCDAVHRNGGASCTVELFEQVEVVNTTTDLKDFHRLRLKQLWPSEERKHYMRSYLRWGKVLSMLWSQAQDRERERGYNYTRVMYVYDSAYWFADGLADTLRAPDTAAEALGPRCSTWGGINDKGMLLTREAANRFLPFYDAFLYDTTPGLESWNNEEFFENLLKVRGVKYHLENPLSFPMTTTVWTQPKDKQPVLCRKPSQNCMPEGMGSGHPSLCCAGASDFR